MIFIKAVCQRALVRKIFEQNLKKLTTKNHKDKTKKQIEEKKNSGTSGFRVISIKKWNDGR